MLQEYALSGLGVGVGHRSTHLCLFCTPLRNLEASSLMFALKGSRLDAVSSGALRTRDFCNILVCLELRFKKKLVVLFSAAELKSNHGACSGRGIG